MRQINDEGLALAKQWESFIPFAYDDADPPKNRRKIQPGDKVRGTLTIGYGHTGLDVKPGMVWSEEKASAFLAADLAIAAAAVERNVKVPLTGNQFAALVIFTLNVGVDAFAGSTLLRKLNAGDYAAVPGELARWNKTTIAGKKVKSAGLVNRRAAEAGLWARGSFVQSSGTPAVKETKPILSPEVVAVGTSIVTGAGSKLIEGDGPVQWAFAICAVLGAITALGLFVRSRLADR